MIYFKDKIARAPPTAPNAIVIPEKAHPLAFIATLFPSKAESSAISISRSITFTLIKLETYIMRAREDRIPGNQSSKDNTVMFLAGSYYN